MATVIEKAKSNIKFKVGLLFLLLSWLCLGLTANAGTSGHPSCSQSPWEIVGKRAATQALAMMGSQTHPGKKELIALTNAGYAEVNGSSTEAALDGLAEITRTSVGGNTLIAIQSIYSAPLWFAVYDPASGKCAYLQVNAASCAQFPHFVSLPASQLFEIQAVENIGYDYLMAHQSEFEAKVAQKVFGGNEFRIITIGNAAAVGAPAYVIQAIKFHDHYCPGVTSGLVMVNWLKKNFVLTPGGAYFVQGIDPWCKEDALMVLLNATPGKKTYAACYATAADKLTWIDQVKNASTIIYRQNGTTKNWDGVVLGFKWAANTGCESCTPTVQKLCMDLWYLERLDQPESFVEVLHTFTLPAGSDPKSYAGPGVDPMKKLGLTQ